MKANSNTPPDSFIDLGGRGLFNYNITTRVTEEGETEYIYDSIKIEEPFSRDAIIRALIKERYSIDDEVALINNYNSGTGQIEYDEYQNYRTQVKTIVDAAF